MKRLTEKNYYGKRANKEYMSVSQFKDFDKCEAMAMAKLQGKWSQPKSKALLLGSYVDESLTGTVTSLQSFLQENSEDIFKKNGEKFAEFQQADETIDRIRNQPLMMKYLTGGHQKIMTGEIAGVPFKIKMDSYRKGEYIADLKYMSSLRSPNLFEPMIRYWGYDLQAACYQEIVRQNTGEQLPFYFVVATKEKPSHLAVGQISQWNMDEALEVVKKKIGHFQALKEGREKPQRCEDYGCDYCTATKVLTEPIDTDLFGMSNAQLNAMKGVM